MPKYLLAALLIVGCLHGAEAQSPECFAIAREALELSGMNDYVDSEAAEINSPEFAQSAAEDWRLPADLILIVQRAANKGLDPQAAKAELQHLVALHCDLPRLKQVVRQLQLPLMVRVTAIEKGSNSPQARQALARYIAAHIQDVPSLPRMAAIEKLDKGIGLSDLSIKLALVTTSGLADGLGIPGAKNMKHTYVGDYARSQVGGAELVASSYIYRSLTDAELKEYVQIMTTEPMKSFYIGSMQSLLAVMEKRSRIIGEEIKSSLPPGSISNSSFSVGAAAAQQQSKHANSGIPQQK